ncbi:MAG: class I SAM-dependent methyltransferase [Planctomycetota bacterium]|nr:MAG: class I SAM-dependent methyltransferase [Planctomycetota bacterium]
MQRSATLATRPGYDRRWDDEIYARGAQLNRWPYDAVVSFLFRHAPRGRDRARVRVLEIGCGAGNNLWAAAREGFDVAGVDASSLAIDAAARRLRDEGLGADLRVAGFEALPFADRAFDLAIDRLALTCAPRATALDAEGELRRVLAPGAKLYTNVLSRAHATAQSAALAPDGGLADPASGTLAGMPHMRFYGPAELDELWARGGWRELAREHVEIRGASGVHAEWRLVLERVA